MSKELVVTFRLRAGKELKYDYFSGTGAGGQHRNKHKNCVRITHETSGVTVQGTEERSRKRNERIALKRLTQHPKFKLWLNTECAARLEGYANLEQRVREIIKPEYLRVEVKQDGKWIKEKQERKMSTLPQPTATTDELFHVILIDRKRQVKMNIQLRDENGDEIPVRETIEKLTEWVSDKIRADEENICRQQIFPLMGQAIVGGMIKLMGPSTATVMLSQEATRYSLMHMMTVGFYLLKWLQKKNIKIYTSEETITAEDIAMYDRISQANDLSVQTAALGGDPKEMVKKLVESGQLKKSDLAEMGLTDWQDNVEEKKSESN